MIRKSGHRFSEKIMLNQESRARWRFILIPSRSNVSVGSRLCENSDVELAHRNFVSITLNRKRTALAAQSKGDKGENNSAHSLLAHVFTQPGSISDIQLLSKLLAENPAS